MHHSSGDRRCGKALPQDRALDCWTQCPDNKDSSGKLLIKELAGKM
jgi:hypothetical protein